ncbi:hypothetical protein [Cytobacillus firmus]|uniref:hypothetical protein n=1 Tax=Cytobacillus firmus TaxID=1399 RepID=UPI0021611FD4|nr:hypothetical protein [Cytobacillus firmus]
MSAKNTITAIASAVLKPALSVRKNAVKWLLNLADKTDIQQGVCFQCFLFTIHGYKEMYIFFIIKGKLN